MRLWQQVYFTLMKSVSRIEKRIEITQNTNAMTIDFSKHPDGLVPAIVQDANTKCVLMLGYMNQEAVTKTQEKRQVTFLAAPKPPLDKRGGEWSCFIFNRYDSRL